jgi:hypothetical protein
VRERLPVEMNVTTITGDQADDHVEAGRLAGAIRAEQANDFPAEHFE